MAHRRPAVRSSAVRSTSLALIGGAALAILAPAFAAPPEATEAIATQPVGAEAIAKGIQPHRAIYKMSLLSARNGSKVSDVRGRMMFEWADACDGWTTEQRFQLSFFYAEGDETAMSTNYTTWESKDGRHFRFNVHKLVNDEPDDDVRGDGELAAAGGPGVVHLRKPEAKDIPLPAGTVFPTAHTLAVLGRGVAGDQMYDANVFEGADAEGATEINTFIGSELTTRPDGAPLVSAKRGWPVRMAFFPKNGDTIQPDYEMGLTLLLNGIAATMRIDYGDFTVDAVLETVEALPKSGC